ncbi:hypothetical protein TRAPUB_7720 [Trametes pubescens]|uniref:Uncharacterized protein n=1 Tax=Trametes pubescens TaxID=154538 RepID=A0A1M2V2J8_TRAPU|nr:hypothetical protein TRAPUB_7720 [Trametes pubescens]
MLYKVALWGHGYLQDFLETRLNAEEIVIYKWRTLDIMAAPAHLPLLYSERLTNLQLSTAPTASIGDTRTPFVACFGATPGCGSRSSMGIWTIFPSTHMLEVKMQRLLQDDSRDPDGPPQENPLWIYLYGRVDSEPGSEPHWKVESCLQGGMSLMAQNPWYLGRFLHGLPLIVQPGLIRELALQFPAWLSAGFRRQSLWRELFGSFHALEHLLLCGWTVIEAATRTLEADNTLFPLLKSLYVCISRSPARTDAHMAMMRWLAARRQMGLPLEAFELRVGKSVSPQTAAWAAQLLDAAKAAELALQIELHDGGMCDVCEWPTEYRLEADDSPDARPGAGAEGDWEWAESDGEDGGSESDYEAHSGSDNDG